MPNSHPSQLNCAVADVVGVVVCVIETVFDTVDVAVDDMVGGVHCRKRYGHWVPLNPAHSPCSRTLSHGPAVPFLHTPGGQLNTISDVVVVVVLTVVLVVLTATPLTQGENPGAQTSSLSLLFT